MESKTRIPKQKSATKKYDKIVKAGWELITEKGYVNTNTKEIAKKAGVSDGIIYQYFEDKHDILIVGLNKYGENIFFPLLKIKDDFKILDFSSFIKKFITEYIKTHKENKIAYEEIKSMVFTDKEVKKFFYSREIKLNEFLYKLLYNSGFNEENLKEKIHVIVGLIDNLCQEIVYHKHREMNYEQMAIIVINSIDKIIKE